LYLFPVEGGFREVYLSRFFCSLFTHSFIFRIDYYNIDTKRIFLLLTRAVKNEREIKFFYWRRS